MVTTEIVPDISEYLYFSPAIVNRDRMKITKSSCFPFSEGHATLNSSSLRPIREGNPHQNNDVLINLLGVKKRGFGCGEAFEVPFRPCGPEP